MAQNDSNSATPAPSNQNDEAISKTASKTNEKSEKSSPDSTPSKSKKINVISSREDLESLIESSGNKVVLIEFHANWCGPCRLIGPQIEELAKLYSGKALIIKVDVDDFEDIAMDYKVTSMPTFVILKNKKQVESLIGSKVAEEVARSLEKLCAEGNSSKS